MSSAPQTSEQQRCACGHSCEHGPHEMELDHAPERRPMQCAEYACGSIRCDTYGCQRREAP